MPPPGPPAFHERPQPDPRDRAQPALRPERQALLRARIKDLRLHLAGTPLERLIHQLYEELEARGSRLRPECYLSDQWGCPSGVPVIGIPFYLADPTLHSIEEASWAAGVESEREIMMYLRHEAGHCFNYAYQLYETEEWRKLFGDYQQAVQGRLQAEALLAEVRGRTSRAGTRRSTPTRTSPRPSRSG